MRLCRIQHNGIVEVALHRDTGVVPLGRLAAAPKSADLLDFLPGGAFEALARDLAARCDAMAAADRDRLTLPFAEVKRLVPIAAPKKVILLAGNYAEHVKEGGGVAAERRDTFPYFFMKPPSTTLTHPGDPIRIPPVSPHHVDWELELGVVLGRGATAVSETEALSYVAGYTVCNDVSDRKFQINPGRTPRERDRWHDWLHGKWHDTFLPCGPCVRAAGPDVDPQAFAMTLTVNGQTMQQATTGQMIFPVAALVAIVSSFVTLEPGDLIVTGTPSGVGHARKPPVYLKAGDVVEATIDGIGTLRNPVV